MGERVSERMIRKRGRDVNKQTEKGTGIIAGLFFSPPLPFLKIWGKERVLN
jgi:hypothetical protein